jgi:probable F420-dependent oxidoreductase
MTLKIGYGLISCQHVAARPQPWTEIYADSIALVAQADRQGFDSAWVTEHHFTEDGYLSALMPMLAAMAVTTTRIRLASYVVLAPLHHPLRLAEDAAAVDVLSNGRLRLGLGVGYRDEEFDALGVPKSERAARLVEHVEVCRKAWTGERFSHHGRLVQVDDLLCRPTPPGPPPIWLGSWVDAGIRRAGRIADGYISPSGGAADTARRIEVLDAAFAAPGRSGPPLPIGTATSVCVTDDGALLPSIRDSMAQVMQSYGDWYSSSSDEGGGRTVGAAIRSRLDDPAGAVVTGTPQQVIDHYGPFVERFCRDRDHHILFRLHFPGMGRSEASDHISRFAETVVPALRAIAP